jgi:hypothetical protein
MMKTYTYAATGAIIQSFLNLEIGGNEYLTQAPINSNTLFVEEEFLFQVWSGGKCDENVLTLSLYILRFKSSHRNYQNFSNLTFYMG